MNDYDRLLTLIGSDAAGRVTSSERRAVAGDTVRRWTYDLMTGVLGGRVEVTPVRHPLGFLCFPVWRGGGRGVCVHVWTAGLRAQPTTSPMHAHSWDLLSAVLYGRVGNQILDVTSATDRPTHRIFEIHSAADGDVVRATAQLVTCRTRSTEHFHSGEVYTLPHGVFHVSDVPGEAATVVLGEARPGRPDRSLGGLATADHWVHRTACTTTETRQAAETVLDHLSTLPEQLEDRCERAT